ncbi:MAG: 4-hydroxy-3-methylbut-2-enyl diphosphate reductase [Dehalococcoidales bacterium]|jgi:4-hydroxy-3-methylbut-2-enyl diphosphate reductase|nr:4-hydroxy-3-methylbut-2-enyl diphosphate reductase [Dehalococcoidales bacterium]
MQIKRAEGIGFCLGVRRAVDIVERVAAERGNVETLGAIVHNQPVLRKLAKKGVSVVKDIADVKGKVVITSSHGVSPEVAEDIKKKEIEPIDTTCPFVKRAQITAERFAKDGFFTIVYGDAAHPEVKGILGRTNGKGIATTDVESLLKTESLPRRLGILSQTTQIPDSFAEFIKKLLVSPLFKDAELRVADTICHDIRQRQINSLELAKECDLVLVVGGHTSANSRHLVELCSTVTPTYLVETADEIRPEWLEGKDYIGVTSGASTDESTIDEVVARLNELT